MTPADLKFPVYRPTIGKAEKEYVSECISSGWISSKGKYVQLFEEAIANYLRNDNKSRGKAIATCNGTVALHLAMLALGVGQGDEVIAPSFTYIASTNCIEYVGAKVIFCDCGPLDWNIDIDKVESLITPRTKAIICVHLYGNPAKAEALRQICDKYGIFMIEDCAESLGATRESRQTGTFGHISTFSFFGNKTLTTGEGGAVYTEIESIYDSASIIKNQGLSKSKEYWHEVIGHNFRMTNMAAAIGYGQISRLSSILSRKQEIDSLYRELLRDSCTFQQVDKNCISSCWMTTVQTESELQRDNARKILSEKGIETRPSFFPIHTMPMYSKHRYMLPCTESIALRGFNIPSYPDLSNSDIHFIADEIKKALKT